MTVGLLVNPASGKESGKGLSLAHLLAGERRVELAVLDAFDELEGALEDFAEAGVDTLFISSGDGTVQAIQTMLAERSPFKAPPRLALLAHGTTNMTAADLGFSRRSLEAIADTMVRPEVLRRATAVRRRATLRAANPHGRPPQHGMFLGAGALWRGTLYCQTSVHKTGLKGDYYAPALTLATALGKALFAKPDPTDETRIDRPYPMTVTADGATCASGDQLLFLATTLEKLVLGARPFWGGAGPGALRATAIAYPPPSILRYTLSIMYGGEERTLPEGCVSLSAKRIALDQATPFVIDGEFFEAPKDGPLIIEEGPEFEYLLG